MKDSKLIEPGKWHIEYNEAGERIAHVHEDSTIKLLGYASKEEYSNALVSWEDAIHPDDLKKLLQYIADLESKHPEGMDYDTEYRIMTKQGYHWVHDCGHVVRREDGSPIHIDGAAFDIQDILEKQETAKQLEESLAFTNFFLNTYVSAYFVDLDTCACQVYTRTEELKKSYPVINNYLEGLTEYIQRDVHPDDRAELINILTPENLKRKLSEVSDVSHIFRDISGNMDKYYKVQAIRGIDAHHAAIGFTDVTEEFHEQKSRLLGAIPLSSDVFTKANIGLWSFELDEGCEPRMYADEAMLKLIGLDHQISPEETYHAWYDQIDPEHYDEVAASVEKMTAGIHAEVQYPWHHPNGETWIVRCGGVRNYEYTKGIRIEGTHQNVTDVAHFQKAKLGTIALDRDILTKASIGLWAFELDEGCPPRMYADDAMLKLIGLDHQISPEETYHAWYDYIDPKHYDEVTEAVKKMTAGIHAEVQYPWHCPCGDTWIVRCGGVRNYAYTKGIRIEGTHQNVTALTHYEKRNLTDLLASLADNFLQVYFLDPYTGKFSSYAGNAFDGDENRDYSQINFYQDVANRSGSIVHHDDKPLIDKMYSRENLIAVLESGQPTEFIIRWPTGNGDECVYMKNRLVPFADDDGTKKLVIGVLDVTSEEQQQRLLEEARERAEAANNAKTSFLFNMSHDIRTPMNAILGYTDIAMNHIDELDRVSDSLQKIKLSGDHLLSLINDILEMSRIEAGKTEIIPVPLNAYEVTESVVTMSRSLAATKDITFNVKADNLKNPYIYSDELHANQIVINLISNAIKYTNPGGTVDYSIEQTTDPEDGIAKYRVTVKDNGIGMSEEFQKHLFESFSREQTTTVSKQEGAGLGLAIVKKIVDRMGGTITVQSKLGEGSTFVVELPIKVMDAEAIEAFEASRKKDITETNAISFAGQKVLLVEDNEMNREIATEILEEVGLVTDTAEDGAIAVKKVMEKGLSYYDFILMDIQMPVMDGYEATAKIRELPGGSKLPIIALSANAFKEDVDRSLAAGMNAHAVKPINVKALFDTIQHLIK